jgi:N-acetylmuramoyl-L-alanine amidase
VAALLAVALPAGPAAAADVSEVSATVTAPDHPEARRIDAYRVDGVDYLVLNDLAYLFRATKYWRDELEKMVLKIGDQRIRVTVGSPFVFVDDDGTQMSAPAIWHDGRIIVPADFASEVLDAVVTETVVWERERRLLRIGTGEPNILAVDWDARVNGTVVEIGLSSPLGAVLDTSRIAKSGRVEVRVPSGVLSGELLGTLSGMGLVDSLVTKQEPGWASLLFVLAAPGGKAEVVPRSSPPRLVVALGMASADDIPAPDFERPDEFAAGPRDVRLVVLDPGHGGSDTGVVSPRGTAEKDVALAIALRAKQRLEQEGGLEVHLTRAEDRYLPVDARAATANRLRPDVLVSIHCNGWFDPELSGFSVGVPAPGEPGVDALVPRWGSRSVRSLRDTEALAEILLEQLDEELSLGSRGIRTGSYALLGATTGPAVHLECGFLTNEKDEELLLEPAFQEKVAQAIARGIGEYRRHLASGEETP